MVRKGSSVRVRQRAWLWLANRALGHAKAGAQRDLLLRHAERVDAEIKTLRIHLDYLRAKAALWDARDRGDADAEADADLRVHEMYPRLGEVVLR
jgi:MerR family transcriptional regulator, copper efflux regulator